MHGNYKTRRRFLSGSTNALFFAPEVKMMPQPYMNMQVIRLSIRLRPLACIRREQPWNNTCRICGPGNLCRSTENDRNTVGSIGVMFNDGIYSAAMTDGFVELSTSGSVCVECGRFPEEYRGCRKVRGKVLWFQYTGDTVCPIHKCCEEKGRYGCSGCSELSYGRFVKDPLFPVRWMKRRNRLPASEVVNRKLCRLIGCGATRIRCIAY